MKVRITERKAPWPQGAKVGDVVEIVGDTLPGWAAGKCSAEPGDVTPDHSYDPASVVVGDGAGTALASQDAVNAEISDLRNQVAAQGLTIEQLIEDVKTGNREESALREQLASYQSAIASEKARADDLQVQLDAAKKAAPEVAGAATPKAAKK